MIFKLAMLKSDFGAGAGAGAGAGVLVILRSDGFRVVVTSPHQFTENEPPVAVHKIEEVDVLPISLLPIKRGNDFLVDGAGADEDPEVGIYLVRSQEAVGMYDVVRRYRGRDTVLSDGARSLGPTCNVLAACSAIGWWCHVSNSGDLETLCVSNAAAILDCHYDEA